MTLGLKQAISKATQDTEKTLTQHLRTTASEHGWHPDVVANMSVKHSNGKFSVDIHPDYADRAFVHEYGDENTGPTAAVRKFSSNEQLIHGTYLHHLNERYTGKK